MLVAAVTSAMVGAAAQAPADQVYVCDPVLYCSLAADTPSGSTAQVCGPGSPGAAVRHLLYSIAGSVVFVCDPDAANAAGFGPGYAIVGTGVTGTYVGVGAFTG
jgi:hypothetical protein